jgi:hypothetical protein
MATTVLFIIVGVAAVAFMVRVLIAFCTDRPKQRCQIIRITRAAAGSSRALPERAPEPFSEEEVVPADFSSRATRSMSL